MPLLKRLVEWFDDDFEIFIHIDKKCREDISRIKGDNIHIFQRYAIEWGDYKHLKAIILLMQEAYRNPQLEYFHLITGSDWPIPTLADFKAFCEQHREENFVEHFPLPHKDWGAEGGLNRIRYWWIRPNLHRTNGAWANRKLIALQRKCGINRPFNYFDGKVYGGSTYWSVSREAVGIALNYISHNPRYLKRFRMTSIGEEICLQTIWCNSNLQLTNCYLRYINWGDDGANPQILTERDYDEIKSSDALFARKVKSNDSDQLIEMLNRK